MSDLFIKPQYLEQLLSIFDNYCPNATIWAYGSRLSGDAHNGSDLDLAVKDFGDENCSIAELKNIITESDIPFLVDIVEFGDFPDSFQKEILDNYTQIYPEK